MAAPPAQPEPSATADGTDFPGAPDLCPVCGSVAAGLFRTHGLAGRPRARCRSCRSLERHRLVWAYFVLMTDLLQGRRKRMLHVAPERVVREQLENHPRIEYLSADLDPRNAMVAMDITEIPYPDSSFDVIYCSHVLEHVPDDRRAMSELLRVLRPGGWAVLAVPTRGRVTYEDLSITEPHERERHFGQHDHLRWYGSDDFAERIRSVGFEVDPEAFARLELGERLAARIGVRSSHRVHLCRRPADAEHRPVPAAAAEHSRQTDWAALEPPALGRWTPTRTVSLVVTIPPDAHDGARLVLAGLAEQTYPRALTEVVLVETGPEAIELPEAISALGVERVRAVSPEARAAGAAAAAGEILVFADGRLLLDPRYLEAHARWHHLATDAVTLGARRHADPGGLSVEDVSAAARSGSLAGLLGAREHWPTEEVRELFRRPEQLAREPSELLGAMARGTFALRADLLAATGARPAGDSAAASDVELGQRLLDRGALFAPERRAIAWHTDPAALVEAAAELERSATLAERVPLAEQVRTRAAPGSRPRAAPRASLDDLHEALYRAKLRALRSVARRSPAAARRIDRSIVLLRGRGR